MTDSHAITAAPLQGVARMVKSRSNPSRLHLIKVLKGGKVVCDENCLMWTSLKICSHCVAVASTIGCLESFVKWFIANTKKPPNITKMTTKHIPQSICKKKSHSRYSKRKGKPPITARVPPAYLKPSPIAPVDVSCPHLPSTSLSCMPPGSLPRMGTSPLGSQPLGPSPLGPPNGPPPLNSQHLQPPTGPYFDQCSDMFGVNLPLSVTSSQPFDISGTISAQNVNVGSYPSSCYPDPYAYWNPYSHSSWDYGPPPVSFSSFLLQSSYSSSKASFQSPMSYGGSSSPYLFWICKINNRITTCFGCRGKFTRAADGNIPVPPLDLILKCHESRQYYGKDGNMHEKLIRIIILILAASGINILNLNCLIFALKRVYVFLSMQYTLNCFTLYSIFIDVIF